MMSFSYSLIIIITSPPISHKDFWLQPRVIHRCDDLRLVKDPNAAIKNVLHGFRNGDLRFMKFFVCFKGPLFMHEKFAVFLFQVPQHYIFSFQEYSCTRRVKKEMFLQA